ncbi:MAG: HNH endonuclease [Pyrinomonadaceae bacterium]
MRKKVPAALRREVIKRAKGYCEYCRSDSEFSDSPFDVEHIVPIAENGKTEIANLALSCHGCNLYKSRRTNDFDVISEEFSRFFNPRKDIWNEHFGWAENYTIIIGLTPIGRVTVETLKLNRSGLLNRRRSLYISGENPPE